MKLLSPLNILQEEIWTLLLLPSALCKGAVTYQKNPRNYLFWIFLLNKYLKE